MNIKLPKNAKTESAFSVDIEPVDSNWDEMPYGDDEIEKLVAQECEKAGITADHIAVGRDNNENPAFATVSHF